MPTSAPTALLPLQQLAVNVRALRARANWSTRALAEHAGVSRFTLQAIEHLRVKTVTVATLDRLATGLGVRTASLLTPKPVARREHDSSVDEVLAENLVRARTERDWTQETLGERSGVSMFVVAHIERQARMPDLSTLERLAQALEMPVDKLLAEPRRTIVRVSGN